jgi:prophage antirepressor-like protein
MYNVIQEGDEKVYLTETEVSKILGLSRQTLLKIRKAGALDTYYRGKKLLYESENVKAFLISRTEIKKHPVNPVGA